MFKKITKLFRNPTADEYAQETLAAAKLQRLMALEKGEYYNAMAQYLEAQITRLEASVVHTAKEEGNVEINGKKLVKVPFGHRLMDSGTGNPE
jgi:pantoate kinase